MATYWELLDIPLTRDIAVIKKAYARKAAQCHPEDNPEGFRCLHEAYISAIEYAGQQESPNARNVTEEANNTLTAPQKYTFAATSFQNDGTAESRSAGSSQNEARSWLSFPKPALVPFHDAPLHDPEKDGAPNVLKPVAAETERRAETWAFPVGRWPGRREDTDEQPAGAGSRTQGSAGVGAVEGPTPPTSSYAHAQEHMRLEMARAEILNLLEQTRKAFLQSSRRTPWEYVFDKPAFSLVRLDEFFLQALLDFGQKKTLAKGVWPVLAEVYASEFALLAGESGTSPENAAAALSFDAGVTTLLGQLKEMTERNLASEAQPASWQDRLRSLLRKP